MLIDLWERIRGYDKWIETTAKVERADVQDTVHHDRQGNVSHTWSSEDRIVWTDVDHQAHDATFTVPDESPLYQMVGGEVLTIRYNPENPDRYYFRELLQSRISSAVKITLLTSLCLGLLALLVWISRLFQLGSPR